MEVIKRNGQREKVSFDKIIKRVEELCLKMELTKVDIIAIVKHVVQTIHDGITTEELDCHTSNICAERIFDDYEYNKLASGLCISNLHKTTSDDFTFVTELLYKHSLVSEKYYNDVKEIIEVINKTVDYDRDYLFNFFAIKTLERSYLIRLQTTSGNNITQMDNKYGKIVERPQHMIMRLAVGIHGTDVDAVVETYNMVSKHYFTHASPSLYNAGSNVPQMSSCFLLGMDDSLKSIYKTISDSAEISKRAGGIGIHISSVRGSGSLIRGTNGMSNGIVPMLKVCNATAKYVNQGGRRNGAMAAYCEPWHPDIFDFCELRQNTGSEEKRARDMFLALWIPDIFMERVRDGGMWSLMCPDTCTGLVDNHSEEFRKLYLDYESKKMYVRQVEAKTLWYHILTCQIETGMPYMLFKDNANKLSNQQNLGTIRSSNLCAEIIQYSDTTEYAVCNLASICLPRFVEGETGNRSFNYDELLKVAKVVTKNLDKIIDLNYYPVPETEVSNLKHRPVGVGVQGLSDVYCMFDLPFDSDGAREMNKRIFETIYFGCISASNELAKIYGPYSSFEGSPFSQGKLQYHLWGLTEDDLLMEGLDWKGLVESVKKYGTRNSLLTALMPTASTSQIMNNVECFEPYTTNLYTRTTLAGEFTIVNRYLVDKLQSLGLWNEDVKNELFYDNGSVQNIKCIPDEVKEVYKTAFEMKTKPIVQQAVERGPFIDQSQSMNLFSATPNFDMLTSSHFYSWKNNLKTGMYYLRSQPAVNPIKFKIDPDTIRKIEDGRSNPRDVDEIQTNLDKGTCRANNYEACEMCSA